MRLIVNIIDIDLQIHYLFYRETNLYICLCNNLNSKKVNDALQKGVSSSKKVYSFYNCKPKCGKCIDLMNCIIEEKSNKRKTV
jgi:bacterioferritin-associated ferredoxin